MFEFPTPYGVENRYLHRRGRALLVLAFCVVAVGVYGHKFLPEPPSPLFGDPWYRAPRWPHLVCALLLALVGGLDLYQRKLQKLLHLTPGQPASLTGEVSREASGSSGGARALMQMLAGTAPAPEAATLDARWQRWLGSLGGASVVLQRFMRARGLLALLAGGLAIVLMVSALLPGGAAVQGAIALLVMAIVTVADARHLFRPERPTPSVTLVATLVLAALAAGVALAFVAGHLGALQPLARLDLPLAALVLLLGVLAAEALALRVAQRHAQVRPRVASARHDVASEWVGDIRRFMADVDRQLFRRWAEGIPNRRYTWLPPRLEAPGGALSAQVLEESQPAPLPAPLAEAAAASMPGLGLMNALYLLALVLPVLGGLACLGSGYLHYVEPLAVWDLTTLGLAALLAGVYAGRLAHTLCSRTEVQSMITWLELEGQYRCPPTDPRERTPTGAQVLPPVTVDSLTLRACAAPLRSAFYAESAATLGGRMLLEVGDDVELARSWGALAADGNRAGTEPAAPAPAPAAAPARPRPQTAPQRPRNPDPPPPRRAPRFCSACGTPVLSGARFCQHCGNVLAPD